MWLTAIPIALTFVMAGCTSLNPLTSDPKESIQVGRVLGSGANSPWEIGEIRGPKRSPTTDSSCSTDDAAFVCAWQSSEKAAHNAVRARHLLEAGIALSDQLCTSWFGALELAQSTHTRNSTQVRSVGFLTSAIQSLQDKTPKTIGVGAALFEAAARAIDIQQDYEVVAAEVSAVSKTISVARRQGAASLAAGAAADANYNFYRAQRDIVFYDNTCSRNEIRILVSSALTEKATAIVSKWTAVVANARVPAQPVDQQYATFLIASINSSLNLNGRPGLSSTTDLSGISFLVASVARPQLNPATLTTAEKVTVESMAAIGVMKATQNAAGTLVYSFNLLTDDDPTWATVRLNLSKLISTKS